MNTPLPLDADKATLSGTSATSIAIKSILRVLFELVVVAILVMAFFLFLLRALNGFFPEGSAIQELISRTDAVQLASNLRNNLLVQSNNGTSELGSGGDLVATLSGITRDVRNKRADSNTWNNSSVGMSLYNQDAIQTFSRSSATIEFDEESQLHLGPDTLVIIKRMEKDVLFSDRRSSLVLVEGVLSGSLRSASDSERHIEIVVAGASAHIRTRDNIDETVQFKISVNSDQSSTIAILAGSAEIITKGIVQKISTDQAVVIRKGSQPSEPKPIPSVIELKTPVDNKTFYYRDIPDKIDFSWRDTSAAQYRLIISRDSQQKNIVLDETLNHPYFTHENLTHGVYYWRVSGIDRDGREGKSIVQRKLTVTQDISAPELTVRFPDEYITSKIFLIRGKSELGANVYINNQQIKTDSATGKFNYLMTFTPGVNVILVEAIDSAGNILYRSQLVNMSEKSL